MHQSMLSPRVGGLGIPRGIWHFAYEFCQIPQPWDNTFCQTCHIFTDFYRLWATILCRNFFPREKIFCQIPWVCLAPLPWGLTLTGALWWWWSRGHAIVHVQTTALLTYVMMKQSSCHCTCTDNSLVNMCNDEAEVTPLYMYRQQPC